MTESKFAITAFGAISEDLTSKKHFPEDEKLSILLSPEKQRQFAEGKPVQPAFDLLDAAKSFGLGRDEALQVLRSTCQDTSAELLRTTVGRDYLLIQTVNALDDLNVVLNTLTSRLRDMWGLHNPELSENEGDNEKFARKVSEGIETRGTVGIPLEEDDIIKIKALDLFKEKAELEKYVEALAVQIAPRMSAACGGSLAARLIAKAGNLERIAFMPSSTVQVLGAEKALFKHLTRGVPCPKHGLIFQHPSLQSAPKNKRGGAARRLAAKISIACRIDYFSLK
jgi:nucleolar protein 56